MTTTETKKQIKGFRKPTETVDHPDAEMTIRYKPDVVQFHSVKIIFPDRNENGRNCVVAGELFVTGTDRSGSWRVDHITLADGYSWPPGWAEEDTDHLRKCCSVFCNGELAAAVLSVELDCGIKIERIENEIE